MENQVRILTTGDPLFVSRRYRPFSSISHHFLHFPSFRSPSPSQITLKTWATITRLSWGLRLGRSPALLNELIKFCMVHPAFVCLPVPAPTPSTSFRVILLHYRAFLLVLCQLCNWISANIMSVNGTLTSLTLFNAHGSQSLPVELKPFWFPPGYFRDIYETWSERQFLSRRSVQVWPVVSRYLLSRKESTYI